MQHGIPGTAPPATAFPSSGQLGPQAGIQAKQFWPVTERDERQILSCLRAPHLWRVTLHGENVVFRVSFGTSSNIVIAELQAPSRFWVAGSCDVYAQPFAFYEEPQTAHAEVTCTPATSGGSAIMRQRSRIAPFAFDPNAARFVALDASVVSVGPGLQSVNVNLNPTESVPLTAGSSLVSGAGYLEFEP
jgi:hypothetical protein